MLLERQMHPLVPSVLFRMGRRDALDLDPEPYPPHAELAQPRRTGTCERWPVVSANRLGQSVQPEQPLEDRAHSLVGDRLQVAVVQEIAAGAVHHRQPLTLLMLYGPEPAFAIDRQQIVGFAYCGKRLAHRYRMAAATALGDQAVAH